VVAGPATVVAGPATVVAGPATVTVTVEPGAVTVVAGAAPVGPPLVVVVTVDDCPGGADGCAARTDAAPKPAAPRTSAAVTPVRATRIPLGCLTAAAFRRFSPLSPPADFSAL
jgi:hypothetical protein